MENMKKSKANMLLRLRGTFYMWFADYEYLTQFGENLKFVIQFSNDGVVFIHMHQLTIQKDLHRANSWIDVILSWEHRSIRCIYID